MMEAVEAAPSGQETAAGDVIVELDEGVDAEALARELGVKPTFVYDGVFNGFAARLPARALERAKRRPGVAKITKDFPVRKFGQTLPRGVDRIDADENAIAGIDGAGGGINVDIAILDTGITRSKDLTVAGGTNCVGGKQWTDGDGHGTHVAGIAAARDNNRDVVGVAPGARLWAVKVLDDEGAGTWSSVICGLDWVFKRRGVVDVVNMSLGGFGNDGDCSGTALHRAVCIVVNRGGIPVVAAAGNERVNADRVVPASFQEAITVSSFSDTNGQPGGGGAARCGEGDDVFDTFSNYGADIDVAAPGNCILSTRPKRGTRIQSGTSMAAPHVAGAIALYLSTDPSASVAEVRSWLLTTGSRPLDGPQGFAGDPDGFPEPVLYLGEA